MEIVIVCLVIQFLLLGVQHGRITRLEDYINSSGDWKH